VAAAASNPQLDATQRPFLTFTVIAVDAKNQPVTDLRAGNFRISDNGVPLAPRCVRFQEPGSRPLSTLVLIDLLNANLSERGLSANDIAVSLRKLEPAGHVYLYLLTKEAKLYPVHGLPADASASAGDDSWTAGIKSLLDKALRAVDRIRPEDFQVDADLRTQATLAALSNLIPQFGALPGRKALVWLSHGVPLQAYSVNRGMLTDYTPTVRRLAAEMNRAQIVAYPVDQAARNSSVVRYSPAADGMESRDTLQEIASLTAGVWFPGNLGGTAMLQAAADTRAMYQVRYVPPTGSWDGKFHKLRVTSVRTGVQVRAIAGYFASVEPATPEGRFALAALGPYDIPDVGVTASLSPSQKVPGWTHFQIHVDTRDLEAGASQTSGEFRVTYVEYVTAWNSSVPSSTPVKFDFKAGDDIAVGLDRPLDPAAKKIRIVVQDAVSGAAGSVTIPVSGR